jgi:hypothetical protein
MNIMSCEVISFVLKGAGRGFLPTHIWLEVFKPLYGRHPIPLAPHRSVHRPE